MSTFATLLQDAHNRGLVRKVKRAMGYLAPMSVEMPEYLTGPDSLPIDLKAAGFKPVGLVTPDGYRFSREVERDEVDALGLASFVRTDVVRVARQIVFNPMEFGRRHLLELRYGTNLAEVQAALDSGEIAWDELDLPIDDEYRFLVIADDGPATKNWIMGRGYHSVKMADSGEESWGQEGAISPELTLDVFVDEDKGTPVRHYLGGTGAKASVDVLGFATAAAG